MQPPDERVPSVARLPGDDIEIIDDVIDITTADDEVVDDAIATNVEIGAGATTEISATHEGEAHAHATRLTGAGAATEISATHDGEAHAHATRLIDPRIRARRIAVAREQGRRRLRVVLVVLSLFVLFGTAWLVVQSPLLDVDHIVVTGIPPERVAAVIAASGVHRRDPLLLVSTGAVERSASKRVPGIGIRAFARVPGNASHQRERAGSRALGTRSRRCRAHRLRRAGAAHRAERSAARVE